MKNIACYSKLVEGWPRDAIYMAILRRNTPKSRSQES